MADKLRPQDDLIELFRPLGWCQNILTVTYTIASFDCCATISSWLPPFPPPTRWCRNEPAMIVGLHSCPNILKIRHVNFVFRCGFCTMILFYYMIMTNLLIWLYYLLCLCTELHSSLFQGHCVSTVTENHG